MNWNKQSNLSHFGLNRNAFAVFTWISEEEGGSFITKFKLESIVVMKTETTSSLKLNVTHLDVKISEKVLQCAL